MTWSDPVSGSRAGGAGRGGRNEGWSPPRSPYNANHCQGGANRGPSEEPPGAHLALLSQPLAGTDGTATGLSGLGIQALSSVLCPHRGTIWGLAGVVKLPRLVFPKKGGTSGAKPRRPPPESPSPGSGRRSLGPHSCLTSRPACRRGPPRALLLFSVSPGSRPREGRRDRAHRIPFWSAPAHSRCAAQPRPRPPSASGAGGRTLSWCFML